MLREPDVRYNRLMTPPRVPREEIGADVSDRREPERESGDAFVDSIAGRTRATIEARLAQRAQGPDRTHPRTEHTELEHANDDGDRAVYVTVMCVSLGVSIPLSAIALAGGEERGLPALMIIWIGIALINLSAVIWSRRS
jgi:hypothetical protein